MRSAASAPELSAYSRDAGAADLPELPRPASWDSSALSTVDLWQLGSTRYFAWLRERSRQVIVFWVLLSVSATAYGGRVFDSVTTQAAARADMPSAQAQLALATAFPRLTWEQALITVYTRDGASPVFTPEVEIFADVLTAELLRFRPYGLPVFERPLSLFSVLPTRRGDEVGCAAGRAARNPPQS